MSYPPDALAIMGMNDSAVSDIAAPNSGAVRLSGKGAAAMLATPPAPATAALALILDAAVPMETILSLMAFIKYSAANLASSPFMAPNTAWPMAWSRPPMLLILVPIWLNTDSNPDCKLLVSCRV